MKIKILLVFFVLALSANAQTLQWMLTFDNEDVTDKTTNGVTFVKTEGSTAAVTYVDHAGFGKAIDLSDAVEADGKYACYQSSNVEVKIADGISFAAWVKPNFTAGGSRQTMFANAEGAAGTNGRNYMQLRETSIKSFAEGTATGNYTFVADVWTHIALTVEHEGDKVRHNIYVNGEQVTSWPNLISSPPLWTDVISPMTIFAKSESLGDLPFTGMADELMCFSGILTSTQITNIMAGDYTEWEGVFTPIGDVEKDTELILYPNPSNGTATVQVANINSGTPYSVISLAGVTVKTGLVENGQIDVSGLQNGLWLVQIGDHVVRLNIN
jgi:hypothetical protein